jgi:hypothetical protein
MNKTYAAFALVLVACGPSYPRGKTVRSQEETVIHYPDPEIAYTPAELDRLQKSAVAQSCKGDVNEGALGVVCSETMTIVFGVNPDNKNVIVATCLGKNGDADCEASVKKIINGRK